MATTQNTYTGNGSTTDYSITFEYLKDADVKVTLDHVATTAFTFPNATTLRFTTAPGNNVAIRIFRDTDVDAARFIYSAGSSIKAAELNENADQTLYGLQETANTDDITDQAVTTAKLRDDAVTTAKLANLSVATAQLADSSVTTAKIAADAVNGTKIADNSINSEHYVDGSIDTAHIADAQVTTAKIADDAVTAAKLANTAVTAGSYTATDITVDAQGRITAASNGAIGTSEITDAAVTTAKIADANVTTAKIADSAITNAKLADAELVELATMGGNTASALADLTQAEVQILDGATVTTAELNTLDGVTATATEINQLDGNTLKASSTDFTSSIQFPSAAEIDSRITARIDPLGGFEAIADEDSFPATAPPVGTVISIANANSLAVNSSGVGAGTRAGGSDAVVINGFPSGFNSTSLDDGIGLLVIATSTAHTYDFHRVVAKNEDVRQLSSDINDFKARYRIGSSNPTTDNDAGDLFFNTGTSKMLVRNAGNSAWQEVQAVGDFFINTISSSSGTGGGSATFNGSAYRFTLSNAPITAQQLLVSINGVVQKPNSGTSQPSEGFVLNGADIIFSAAPASGAAGFFITIGSSVGIGTPSDNTVSTAKLVNDSVTNAKIADDSIDSEHYVDGSIDTAHIADSAVTSAKIADGTIVNADVNASAAIAGTKISPDFGSQNVITTGKIEVGTVIDLNTNGSAEFAGAMGVGVSPQDNVGTVFISETPAATGKTLLALGDGNGVHAKLDSDGSATFASNVGIGTTSPQGKLHLAGSAVALYFEDTASSNTLSRIYKSGSSLLINSRHTTAGQIVFNSENSSGTVSERMRIDSSGRLLLGTSSAVNTNTGNIVQVVSGSGGAISLARNDTETVAGNQIGAIRFLGNDTLTSGGYEDCAQILCEADANHTDASKASRLRFMVTGVGADTPTERMRISSSGQLFLGTGGGSLPSSSVPGFAVTTNAGVCLVMQATSDAGTNTVNKFINPNGVVGTIQTSGSSTSFNTSSDYRLKENVVDIADGITRVKQLSPRRFNFIADDTTTVDGFLAHEAQTVVPEAVTGTHNQVDDDGNAVMQGIDQSKLVPLLTAALQEAIAKIETLETQNASLEARLTALEGGS